MSPNDHELRQRAGADLRRAQTALEATSRAYEEAWKRQKEGVRALHAALDALEEIQSPGVDAAVAINALHACAGRALLLNFDLEDEEAFTKGLASGAKAIAAVAVASEDLARAIESDDVLQ